MDTSRADRALDPDDALPTAGASDAAPGSATTEGNAAAPAEAVAQRLGSGTRVDDQGRLDPLATVGGARGIVEASLPTLVFMVAYMLTTQVWPSAAAAVGVALVMALVRVAQRQSPVQAGAGMVMVVICAVVALTTGQARDFYVIGFFTNAGYAVAFIVSIFVGWPLVGLIFGLVRGEGVAWRQDPARRRAYAVATWIMVVVLLSRLAVQVPLYFAEAETLLGAARLVMGLPFYALGLWLAWRVSAPAERSGIVRLGTGPR
ncbi:MAG: DUF3159 domain-containing protein [Micrococcus sp.]|nr:DUF3159 domain-containing protein [Micrococcus sp.]